MFGVEGHSTALNLKAALNCLSLTEKGGSASAGHVNDGQLPVSGVPNLLAQPVQRGVGDHDELLGRQVLLDPEEGTMACIVDVQIGLWSSIQQEVWQKC